MDYMFRVNLSTDGDFSLPYTPCGMEYDDYESYELEKTYSDRTQAINDITDICAFMKEQLRTSRDYVKEDFNKMIDDFVLKLYSSEDTANTYIRECMYGNYDGTEIVFQVEPHRYNLGLRLTDEEWELIKHNEKLITFEQVKEAVLALFK